VADRRHAFGLENRHRARSRRAPTRAGLPDVRPVNNEQPRAQNVARQIGSSVRLLRRPLRLRAGQCAAHGFGRGRDSRRTEAARDHPDRQHHFLHEHGEL
jgi:hypothetical protein